MEWTRRKFLKASAAAAAFAAAGAAVPRGIVAEAEAANDGVKWGKAPCRFCGTGCGVLVGVKDGRIVATKGDPAAPVNRGLNCIKGYFLSKILYGKDRLTTPLIREGKTYRKASWDEAMTLIAAKFKENIDKHGPNSVAIYGSGQWTVMEGYAASKLFKGGIGTNNVEPNARLCMASAVTGFMSTFASDEPMGCYDDLDLGDTYFLWGANMAECHPVLFSRLIDNRLKNPKVKIVDLGTRRTRTSQMADMYVKFVPQTDLALLNGIAHIIVRDRKYDENFVKKHVVFKKGKENIGYGLEDKTKLLVDDPKPMTFEEYREFLKPYTPEYVSKLSGVPVKTLEEMAALYGDRNRKVNSLWTMGFNQHTRGTWVNNLVYNVHLLTGKICRPGENPMSLTGQPSACGTAREVGTFTHRLPADMVVTNPEHREKAAKIWNVPVTKIPDKPSLHTVEMFRALDRGDLKVIWIQVTNPFQSMPKLNRYRAGAKKGDGRFIVVSDIYPTQTTELADVILPSAGWVEKEGVYGNAERRAQHWFKQVEPPGEAKGDLWQTMELAKRLGHGSLFAYKYPEKEIWEEYRQFTLGGKDLAPYEAYTKARGLRWPVVNGKETLWRYAEGYDPYVKPGEGIKFYKNKKDDGRAVIWARPYEPAAEAPDKEYPFWLCTGRVLEHWHTGTMTGRVPELKRAYPAAVCEMHPDDARKLKIKHLDKVKVTSRRGTIVLPVDLNGRGKAEKGNVFVAFFDETKLINELCIDAFCPISGEPDYKKCAVKVEKA